ncbi:MAG: hypothetical protein U1F76_27210 [Candidatus Competibacteraceae bacterium]
MKQKSQNHTWKLALLAAGLLSSGAVQAFPSPLNLPPPASPDIAVQDAAISFVPGAGSIPGTLTVTQTGNTGFSLDTVGLPTTSDYDYKLEVKTDPTKNNAFLSGTLLFRDTTLKLPCWQAILRPLVLPEVVTRQPSIFCSM